MKGKKIKTLLHKMFIRKSDVFIIAYILFILYSLVALLFYKEAIVMKTIAGIIITGLLFSISEFLNFRADINSEFSYQIADIRKRLQEKRIEIANESISYHDEHMRKAVESMNELSSKNSGCEELSELYQQTVSTYQASISDSKSKKKEAQLELANSKTEFDDILNDLVYSEERITLIKIWANILLIVGVLSFLIILTIEGFPNCWEMVNNHLTIATFAIVIITLYARDYLAKRQRERIVELEGKLNEL